MDLNTILQQKKYIPIVEYITGKNFSELLRLASLDISETKMNTMCTLIMRAKQGTPIPYLTHQAYFYKDIFFVDERVLIPRPETEHLVEAVITYIESFFPSTPAHIIDVGTGSGCIGISIAKYVSPIHNISLLDISSEVLDVCRRNIQTHILPGHHVHMIQSDLLKSWKQQQAEKINVLIANLPYISTASITELDHRVRDYEPHIALDGGPAGDTLIQKLLEQVMPYLADTFLCLMEIGEGQSELLLHKAEQLYPKANCSIEKDLFHKNRYLKIQSQQA